MGGGLFLRGRGMAERLGDGRGGTRGLIIGRICRGLAELTKGWG